MVQERIELGAGDCGLVRGWLLRVYKTVNVLFLAGKARKAPGQSERADLGFYWLGVRTS